MIFRVVFTLIFYDSGNSNRGASIIHLAKAPALSLGPALSLTLSLALGIRAAGSRVRSTSRLNASPVDLVRAVVPGRAAVEIIEQAPALTTALKKH